MDRPVHVLWAAERNRFEMAFLETHSKIDDLQDVVGTLEAAAIEADADGARLTLWFEPRAVDVVRKALLDLGVAFSGAFERPESSEACASAAAAQEAAAQAAEPPPAADPYDQFRDLCRAYRDNIDLDGAGGSGKTVLTLEAARNDLLQGRTVGLCAMSGTAADAMNRSWSAAVEAELAERGIALPVAQTFHVYFALPYGIGQKIGIAPADSLAAVWAARVKKNDAALERWKRSRIYIDEKSMMEAELLDVLCKTRLRLGIADSKLVLIGDFAQLPPIDPTSKRGRAAPRPPPGGAAPPPSAADAIRTLPIRPLFKSPYYRSMFPTRVMLNRNHRAAADPEYAQLMAKLRLGKLTAEDISMLSHHNSVEKEVTPEHIWLVPNNEMAHERNTAELDKLKRAGKQWMSFRARTAAASVTNSDGVTQNVLERVAEFPQIATMINGVIRDFGGQIDDPHEFAVGSRVMLRANLKVGLGLVNGAQGTVVAMTENKVDVRFDNGVGTHSIGWMTRTTDSRANRAVFKIKVKLMPLTMAHAITIHKSQGMTLDKAFVKLTQTRGGQVRLKVQPGSMVYVAMSRVRRLADVVIDGIELCDPQRHLRPSEDVVGFYAAAMLPDRRPGHGRVRRELGVPPDEVDCMVAEVWTTYVPCPVLLAREEVAYALKRKAELQRVESAIERKRRERATRRDAALRRSDRARHDSVGEKRAGTPLSSVSSATDLAAAAKRPRIDSVGRNSVFSSTAPSSQPATPTAGAPASADDMLC